MNNPEFRSGAINASECLSEGWNLIKPNYGVFLGMAVVFVVITILVSIVPYVGAVLNIFASAILLCGIYRAILNQSRGTDATFSMMFETFDRLVPTSLVQLLQTLPMLVLPLSLYFLANFTTVFSVPDDAAHGISSFGLTAPIILMSLFFYLLTIIAQILMFFALPLIADRNVGFVEAVRLSVSAALGNVGGIILLFLLEFVVALGGTLALCIGILFVVPVIYAANIVAYRRVFPNDRNPFSDEPPRPDAYGDVYGTQI